jgi:cyclic-di-GMP phosphodiesterase TipF (flagellum assembly factor)
VQGLVYIFIALSALGIGGAAYFGLTFTPIEAIVTALCFGAVAVVLMERQLRQRAEQRLERAIEDLARLLSTDAQAGQVLSQRINQLTDTNAGSRLEAIEADISVLGTVVRQVAEAVAELEDAQRKGGGLPAKPAEPSGSIPANEDMLPEPVIPIEMLRQALGENRLVCHIEPVVQLPQRKPYAYDVVPRLMLEDAEFADPPDFMPRRGHPDIIRRIEGAALEEAIVIARRAKTAGQPIRLFVPLTRDTMADEPSAEFVLSTLDANRVIANSLGFAIPQAEWKRMTPSEKIALAQMYRSGVNFSLAGATSLRFDFSELESVGFQSVRVDATRYLRDPPKFTDFHAADVAPYLRRFHIELCATGVIDEQQLLTLFEDGVSFAQGPHIGKPGPVRPDLVMERGSGEPTLRRVEM